MSHNHQWLNYWLSTLKYADNKPIDFINDPLTNEQFTCIEAIEPKLAKKLWRQARAKPKDNAITIVISPAQSSICINQQYTDNVSECVFWIEASMDKQGKVFVTNKNKNPFFIRDFLTPNPKDNLAIANVEDIDIAIESFKFENQNWYKRWQECEYLFRKVTGKSFNEFNTFDKAHYYIEVAPLRGVSHHIINLYKSLLEHTKSATQNSSFNLLSNLISNYTPDKHNYPVNSAFTNFSHVGQFDGKFPLSYSQRISMEGFTASESGEVIAINGPPGTGKTTLLQSIVANLTVQNVLNNQPPALIVACSTNNQAITNILTGFKLPDNNDLLTERWLPDIPSLGLYMAGKESNDYLMYSIDGSGGTKGFFNDYESKAPSELKDVFIANSSKYLNESMRSIDHAKEVLKKRIIDLNTQITYALRVAVYATQAPTILQKKTSKLLGEDNGFNNAKELESYIESLKREHATIIEQIKDWRQAQESLYQSYDRQSIWAKLLRFLPVFKQRRAIQFKRIIAELNVSAIEIREWSNHFHIIERIDHLLTKLNTTKQERSQLINSLDSALNEFRGSIQKWQLTIDSWERNYLDKLDNLYKNTGQEYQNLDPIKDMNIRLDISWRFESFWLAMHFREAEYIGLLEEYIRKRDSRKNKRHNEFGRHTYKGKLQRFACLTPIFISTFHTLPRMAQYFNHSSESKEPNFELFDYLIVDEAGQVAVDVAIPSFSLAKTAVVVGDTLQIEPVYSITEPMDIVVYKSSIADSTNEEKLDVHASQGKLSSSGSLMLMAQHANKYQRIANSNGEDHITDGLLLTEHRRCLDAIIKYSNDHVYHGELEPMRGNALDETKQFDFIGNNVAYIHIEYASEARGTSRINKLEAGTIAYWINDHHEALSEGYDDKPIHEIVAVVTPYKPQALEIKEKLVSYSLTFKKITVGTVHSLQGAERPIVLFSVVASPQDSLMFLNSKYNLLNVAISRAKDYFIVFGDMNTLSISSNTPLGNLGNLGKWLLSSENSEINNSFVYDMVGSALKAQDTNSEKINNDKSAYYPENTLKEHINDIDRHDKILASACKKAESELLIVSPYLSVHAIGDNLKETLSDCVTRGVNITVYFDDSLNEKGQHGKKVYKENAQLAITLLQGLGVNIRVMSRLHAKTMLFHTKKDPVLIEGSFNWLSAVRDKQSNYHRYETSIVLTGNKIAKRYEELKKFFESNSKPL